jgi:hypothetical protein
MKLPTIAKLKRKKILETDKVTFNSRIYPKEVIDKALKDKELKKKLKDRTMFVYTDIDTRNLTNKLEDVCGVVTKLYRRKNVVYADVDAIMELKGGVLKTALDADVGRLTTMGEGDQVHNGTVFMIENFKLISLYLTDNVPKKNKHPLQRNNE